MDSLEKLTKCEDKGKEIGYKKPPKLYATDLMLREFMYKRLTEGYEEGGRYIPQNVEVCNYFNIGLNDRTQEILKQMKKHETEDRKFEDAMNFFDRKNRK